jgi:coenzyme F420-reducing hydrogenase alpha subunit
MKTQLFSVPRNFLLIIFLAVLSILSSSAIFAQQKGPGGYGKATPEERAKRLTEMMKENLSLTAVQEPKVSAINLKYAKKVEDVRKTTDTAAQRKALQNLNNQKDGELKTVLTADQFKSYLKQMEEMKARRRGMQH